VRTDRKSILFCSKFLVARTGVAKMIVDPEGLIHSFTTNLFAAVLLKKVDDPSILIGKPFKELVSGGMDVLKASRDSGPEVGR
jgi:hypothetical protein